MKTYISMAKRLAVMLLTALVVTGCANPRYPDTYPIVSTPSEKFSKQGDAILDASYDAADAMVENLGDRFPHRFPIVVGSFVNGNDFNNTTALGRLTASQMAARLTQAGYTVTEIKLRQELLMQPKRGEFVLTRELDKIAKEMRVEAILAGTYTEARNRVYFNTKLIRIKDRATLAAQDFSIGKSSNVRVLLNPKSRM
uniref:FlgO domain-containing protein n=1 Tax=Magnetococcus massalia (strain MO-1) TaxID=451514 RepID=A0A1S7LJI5_MAGMO|nr:Conserved exported protein of unknown function [Candidatus Magnetococcus massalia]